MTQSPRTVQLTPGQATDVANFDRKQALIVAADATTTIAPSQFEFFAAFDGTNNTLEDSHPVANRYPPNLTGSQLRIHKMKLIKTLKRFLTRWPAILAMGSALAANASELQLYSFEFDLRKDNQHAVVLDFWYGNSKLDPWINVPEELVQKGNPFYFEGVTQPMMPGGTLYVKWRDTNTEKVYEDTVDLRHRLPKNIENHRIYLMIRGPQLYVYLISPEDTKRSKGEPPNGPSMYADLKTIMIYPDQVKP